MHGKFHQPVALLCSRKEQTFSGSLLFEKYYLEVVSIICSESTKGRQAESKREQETRLAQAALEDFLSIDAANPHLD